MRLRIAIIALAAASFLGACGGDQGVTQVGDPNLCDRIAIVIAGDTADPQLLDETLGILTKGGLHLSYSVDARQRRNYHVLGKRDPNTGQLLPRNAPQILGDVQKAIAAAAGATPKREGVSIAQANPPNSCSLRCDVPPDAELEGARAILADETRTPAERAEASRKVKKLEEDHRNDVVDCPAGFSCVGGKCVQACAPAPKGQPDAICDEDGRTCWSDGQCHKKGTKELIYNILDFPGVKWVFLILALVMPLASILTWMERRQSAMMQDRLGPNRANIGPIKLKGILHFVADAVKMIFKEDFIPANVHRGLFALAPILAIAPVFIAFCIIPFGPTVYPHSFWEPLDTYQLATQPEAWTFTDSIRMQMFRVDFGLIFYFAVLTLANYGGTIAGWASYNKWALLGGLRSSSQMMSYEVAMGISLIGAFLVVGSLEPGEMVELGASASMSPSNPLNWLWLWQPVGIVLFFTAAIAETKRAPFDIPEGEPEIIGYFVEYSGLRWGLFFLAEFIEIVFISAVMTTVFLGGWQVPFLDPDGFRIGGYVDEATRISTGGNLLPLPHGVVIGLQFAAFGAKVVLMCWLQLMIRWTLPRFRADQLMNLGWKLLLPLALANVMVTALLKLIFMGT